MIHAKIDIIDQEYCLLYDWSRNIDLEQISSYLKKWNIFYSQFHHGFVLTHEQTSKLKLLLRKQFGIIYEVPSKFSSPMPKYDSQCEIQWQKELKNWQIRGLEKCYLGSMRYILGHQWSQGKTVISILIAKYYNKSLWLVVVCPRILHLFWRKHLQKYYGGQFFQLSVQFAANGSFQSSKFSQLQKVLLVDPSEMFLLPKLSQKMKKFIIIDEFHILNQNQVQCCKDFTNGLALTSNPEQCSLLLLQFIFAKTPSQSIINRYSNKSHQYEEYCILRNYSINDVEFSENKFMKKIVSVQINDPGIHKKIFQMLINVNLKDQFSPTHLELEDFSQILFQLKQKQIYEYLDLSLQNKAIKRKFYYMNPNIQEMFLEISIFRERTDCSIQNLREMENVQFQEDTVHTFLQMFFDEQIFFHLSESVKTQFLVLQNSPERQFINSNLLSMGKKKLKIKNDIKMQINNSFMEKI